MKMETRSLGVMANLRDVGIANTAASLFLFAGPR
jgi:hypothetical protein